VDIRLRPYTRDDFEALYRLDQECYPPGIAYTRPMLRWFLAQPAAVCLLAEAGGVLAGFVLADREGREGHIITLDVAREHRRRGVGTRLVAEAERALAAAGVARVELETATEDPVAVAFWESRGYRSCGVLRKYYLNRHDAYWMAKTLAGTTER
jgi:ribosomal protein S18 acetylase RimI-like enzyme